MASFLLVIVTLGLPACDKSNLGTVDNSGLPPFARNSGLSPDSIRLTSITPVGGVYTVGTDIHVTITDPAGAGNIAGVTGTVFPPGGDAALKQALLHDDGQSPDLAAADNIYSARLQFGITKTDAGAFRVRFQATDAQGLESNALEHTLYILRNNAPPVLSNLVAPDTVTLQATSVALQMQVTATDPDGLSDVREVYFRSLNSSDPTRKFFLAPVSGGDPVASNGVFGITIQLDPQNERKTYRFAFQAADAFGDTSATLLHLLTVR